MSTIAPVGALLRRVLRSPQVFSTSTDVGKTVLTTLLCKSASKHWGNDQVSYLKPVSTGALEDADEHHIKTYVTGVKVKTLFQYDLPMSPHSAAQASGKAIPTDQELLAKIHEHNTYRAAQGATWLFLETAGGIHSPGPSGTTQADLYAPLRSPVILVGDSKLGGISQTISAFESLHIRGYNVQSVILFRDDVYENYRYLTDYFGDKFGVPVSSVAPPPKRRDDTNSDREIMGEYYAEISEEKTAHDLLKHVDQQHHQRLARLEEMATRAHQHIWYPFTQQKLLAPKNITVIDSAYGDHFQTLHPEGPNDSNLLQSTFDGSASWWTQGLGHSNPQLTLAAAHAAGRYGHVMFAEAIHEPALSLAETLLQTLRNPRLHRVFYSDNGSTGCEVAVKMALRAARKRYGWGSGEQLGVLGLKGSYHGDTIGAMDCSEPCTFNEKVEWYEGKGYWFDYPTVMCTKGKWNVDVPEALRQSIGSGEAFESLAGVFDLEARSRGEKRQRYEAYIEQILQKLRNDGRKFGALMLEPVILGAGGMVFVDPLFQRTLVDVVRRSPQLFATSPSRMTQESNAWTGLPVVFDEVFTGLYRLGQRTSSAFLGVQPDISVHAKLLTGGLVPLCATLASESIFEAFISNDKSDALLHGHSYTAHPVGCHVALESLHQLQNMDSSGSWDAFKSNWSTSDSSTPSVWSVWSRSFVDAISHHTSRVVGVWSLGSVLAITLQSNDGTGYTSTAAATLRERLRQGDTEGRWNVHARVLGNVFYVMVGQKTTPEGVARLEKLLYDGLFEEKE